MAQARKYVNCYLRISSKSLPPSERAEVAKFVVEQDDSWIPDEFKEAMKDAEEGRCVDMETALFQTPPAHLQ